MSCISDSPSFWYVLDFPKLYFDIKSFINNDLTCIVSNWTSLYSFLKYPLSDFNKFILSL